MHTNIFQDLEIETEGFLSGEVGFLAFATRVATKAKELEDIMAASSSASSIEVEAEEAYNKDPEMKKTFDVEFKQMLIDIYEDCETLPLPIVCHLIEELRTLAKDLTNTVNARAKKEAINQSQTLTNKKLAHIQHKMLRETWEAIRKSGKLMFKVDVPGIKPRSGNFAPSLTKTYGFIFPGNDEPFYNHLAVAEILGIRHEKITFQDVMDYCERHPELVSVTEVEL